MLMLIPIPILIIYIYIYIYIRSDGTRTLLMLIGCYIIMSIINPVHRSKMLQWIHNVNSLFFFQIGHHI